MTAELSRCAVCPCRRRAWPERGVPAGWARAARQLPGSEGYRQEAYWRPSV